MVAHAEACALPKSEIGLKPDTTYRLRNNLEFHMPHTPELALLLKVIDQAYDHRSWHGTNLRGSIRGLSLK